MFVCTPLQGLCRAKQSSELFCERFGIKGEGLIKKEKPSLEIVTFRQRLKDNFSLSLGESRYSNFCVLRFFASLYMTNKVKFLPNLVIAVHVKQS